MSKYDNIFKGHIGNWPFSKHVHKSYKCEECAKEYTSKGGLRNHMQITHGHSVYDCDKCDRKYHSERTLLRYTQKNLRMGKWLKMIENDSFWP